MTWRIRDRRTFDELRRRGRRVREGPLTVTYLLDGPSDAPLPPRVAYAIGRKVGGAVVRNRVRRRLRAVVAELAGQPDRVPPGAYLLSAGPAVADLASPDLREMVDAALHRIDRPAPPGPAPSRRGQR